MAKTAKLVKELATTQTGATQRLWAVDPAMAGYSGGDGPYAHVVTSAVDVFGEPETYIFGADEWGTIVDWSELPGSFKGAHDHERAIRVAGYEVVR